MRVKYKQTNVNKHKQLGKRAFPRIRLNVRGSLYIIHRHDYVSKIAPTKLLQFV